MQTIRVGACVMTLASSGGGVLAEHPLMKALDANGDGSISAQEIDDAPVALRYLDDDGDGALSREEAAPRLADWDDWGDDWGDMDGMGRGDRTVPAEPIQPGDLDFRHGTGRIGDRSTFRTLSYKTGMVMSHLKGHEFVKFQIEDADSDAPRLYFMNTETHPTHFTFMRAIGAGSGYGGMRGVLVFHPTLMAPNGERGLYSFEFDLTDSYDFAEMKLAFDLLEANSRLLAGALAYFVRPEARQAFDRAAEAYEAAALPVLRPEDLYAEIGYLPLNPAESFGRLRLLRPGERPGSRDIVICETLPNEMPRVAGIITGVRQTPLSHVNLRAIQDGVPNAYVLGAATDDVITPLIGRYVRYTVRPDGFEITEATAEEVNAHFVQVRPARDQTPARDLSETDIRSLDELDFGDAASIGAKAANLAAMRRFGLPGDLVPDGFAVPFSFYDAFMKHNGFYERAAAMRAAPGFLRDTDRRQAALAGLRREIRAGEVPDWMDDALDRLHESFPAGTPLRCRSSTNNEDLRGFSGAGLYDSFTHHPNEGLLSKSIRQVYASLWNFRAYEEREFFRIDHAASCMGVLVHRSFRNERANGVAISEDVVYGTAEREAGRLYYVNLQVGENLVTNPKVDSVPEELLLSPRFPRDDVVVRRSNRVEDSGSLMSPEQIRQLRVCLKTIDREFRALYEAATDDDFAIEVEFKITSTGTLAIKQARPWVD